MKKGWFVFILYICLLCAGVCSARAAAAEPDSGDVMLSENPDMFAEEVVVELDEQNTDEGGIRYLLYGERSDWCYAYACAMDYANYDLTQDYLEIRIPDKVMKDQTEYKVREVKGIWWGDIINARTKVKFYVGKYVEELECGAPCSRSSFFVHPENGFLTTENGSLFDRQKETLMKFYDGIYSPDAVYNLPESVRTVNGWAFRNVRLKEVVLGDRVTTIQSHAFEDARIQRMDLNQVQDVDLGAFHGCKCLWDLAISREGTFLREQCFIHCDNLESVYLPAGTKLGDECFSYCQQLETVIMEDGCKFETEKAKAFYKCINLKALILPDDMTSFCWNMIDECNMLEKLYLPTQLRRIVDGSSSREYQYAMTFYCVDPERLTIEHAEQYGNVIIESLAEHVHQWKNVTFLSIGETAVVGSYCPVCGGGKDIEKVTWREEELPPLLKADWQEYPRGPECLELDDTNKDEFGISYQLDLAKRTAEIIKTTVTKYHNRFWKPPSAVKSKGITYTVENIGSYTFYGYGLVIPDTVTELNTLSIPNGLELLALGAGVRTLTGNSRLKAGRIIVSEENTCFCSENNVLYNKDKTKLLAVGTYGMGKETVFTVPPSVKEIGPAARFEKGLQKVRIYNKEDIYIDDEVFFGEDVEIEYLEWGEPLDENNMDADGRTYILNEADKTAVFVPKDLSVYEGGELETPYKVEKDGEYYLVNGISFEQVTVPNVEKVVLKISRHISRIDFGSQMLNKIYCEVNWENTYFRQMKGSLLSVSRDTLYHYYDEEPGIVYHLPLQVEKIGKGAFRGADICAISGGEQLIGIGEEAFMGCSRLEGIMLQKTGMDIGDRAFSDCVHLRNMYLPPDTKVGNSVFQNCQTLQMIVLDRGTEWGVYGNIGMSGSTKCYDHQSMDEHEHTLWEATFFCYEDWGVKGRYCKECDLGTEYEVVPFLGESDRDRMPDLLVWIGEEQIPSPYPTQPPTEGPTVLSTPSPYPSEVPTLSPTENVTEPPTASPSAYPSEVPTQPPTEGPTVSSTASPSPYPGEVPTRPPTERPTAPPTPSPGEVQTQSPAERPTESPMPSKEQPILQPSPNLDVTTAGDEQNLFLQYKQGLNITGFRVSVTKDKAVKLSWDRNIYAKSYQVYRAASRAGDYKLVKMVDQSHISYVDRGIKAKKKYFYKVRALGIFSGTLLEGNESIIRSVYTAGIGTPRMSVKKGQSGSVRYIVVELKYYEEKNIEIYISKNNKKFKKLKLVSNKIAKYKGRFKIKCMVKNQKIRFKVRTYGKVGKKRIYSGFSKVKSVQV